MCQTISARIALLLTLGLFASCDRLGPVTEDIAGGRVTSQILPGNGTVPQEWGRLASVTGPVDGNKFQLWFEDSSGDVRMVALDTELRILWVDAIVVPRQ